MHFVYILKSLSDKSRYYIGIIDNIDRRLIEHNTKDIGYSKRYAPWELTTFIAFKDKNTAEKFEIYLKAGSGQAFLKKHFLPAK